MDTNEIIRTLDLLSNLEERLKSSPKSDHLHNLNTIKTVKACESALNTLLGYLKISNKLVDDINPVIDMCGAGWNVCFKDGTFKEFISCKKCKSLNHCKNKHKPVRNKK